MTIFHKYFKYNDSWMWCSWVKHQKLFGLPHLRIAFVRDDLYFIFELIWGKIYWYWTTGHIKNRKEE